MKTDYPEENPETTIPNWGLFQSLVETTWTASQAIYSSSQNWSQVRNEQKENRMN